MKTTQSSRRISILRDSVARKIAAGEVIDRPFSVLRELVDNSIDAQAATIDVSIEKGGISLLEVTDDGWGMSREDIQLCWLSHATSKISHEDDLMHVHSLGFRGEALSSIAAVSRLEIVSRSGEMDASARLIIEGGGEARYGKVTGRRGTRVSVRDLFYNLPARRKFMKSSRSESVLCRNAFLEKALPHPERSFRLFADGKPRLLLPETGTSGYISRISAAYPEQCPSELLQHIHGSGDGFTLDIVLGIPPLFRQDRKYIQIYCNRRRINEFSLIHAVEYAFDSILPGGNHPVAFVFLEIDPELVDFNIHPAKREVRFARPEIIHRRVRELIEEFIGFQIRNKPQNLRTPDNLSPVSGDLPLTDSEPPSPQGPASRHNHAGGNLHTAPAMVRDRAFQYHSGFDERPSPVQPPGGGASGPAAAPASIQSTAGKEMPAYRYLGQIFSVFLLVEMEQTLYIIDMHAAHERILYDRFRSSSAVERLLIPFTVENDDPALAERMSLQAEKLRAMGFDIRLKGSGNSLEIHAIPAALKGKERLLRSTLAELERDSRDLEVSLYEKMACRTAVKDGDVVDSSTARSIIEASWRLPEKRCPHGRPIWFTLSKEELYQIVGRT
ncbi:DNA mismatch repair endonuclease MutL [Salinispira pacifica]|uniref:DNA mismatch repair protein MutL n=1 Tax=Salinispira pacifica TaxID=1307761 RepID=V5WHN6_9SPIO|nr:DNA mismatch repair endonuclease MutL [Salinispira pacifica]AHC15034.1 DNA mismatch repair protein MutL [Salinispira pacifica]